MAFFAFFAVSVLAATAVHVAGQEGFLSIDCGLDAAYSGRRDADTGIVYVSDSPYVDGGENRRVAADQEGKAYDDVSLLTLRSFPSGLRNCYTLPTQSGGKYLVRMEFLYGNYDGQNRSSMQFDLYLGTNHWDTYMKGAYWWSEAIFLAWASWVPVCLVNTGSGTPFVNTVELRPLGASLYPEATTVQSLSAFDRGNPGATRLIRFPGDPYDRFWGWRNSTTWEYLYTTASVKPDDTIAVPIPILQTAAVAINNGTVLDVITFEPPNTALEFKVFVHFADFQNTQLRQFDVHISDHWLNGWIPSYLSANYVYSTGWTKAINGKFNVTLTATNVSALPPMINAYEVYTLIRHDTRMTFSKDFDAMMAIKVEYGVKKNWMGDPCFPARYAWDGVKCMNSTNVTMRIISLDLSNSNLNGVISDNFTLLTELKFLFPGDPYDRFWGWRNSTTWEYLYTTASVKPDDTIAVPIPILQTAAVAINNGTVLDVITFEPPNTALEFKVFVHFADFQNTQLRQFDVHISDHWLNGWIPSYLSANYVYSTGWTKAINGKFNVTLTATNVSALPPMINAYEVYTLIRHDTRMTFSKDFDAMMAIKVEYGVKKNWMGDPCFPARYAWDGVKCMNSTNVTMRIISLDLSNSNLNGVISDNFTLLTELKFLDLSGNSLKGEPYTLCKKNAGPLVFRYNSSEDICKPTISPPPSRDNNIISPPPSRNKTNIISISVVVPVVAVAGILLSYLIWRWKRKPEISTHDSPRESELQSAPGSTKRHGDSLQNTENRRFTYKELEKVTNNFKQFIGQGSFGLVYYGCLEDDSEVAVKMRSESSSHGLDVFLAEVHSLTKVHHRNVVSLVGYCMEKDHLALVYEYMPRGNLCDHLKGKNGDEIFHWATRVRVVLETAQGLEYLHKGCSLPIIHRDVKTSNILLGQNLQAKVADFGLSKSYLSETQTHISTNLAGSAGYFDPEYYHTGRLTESSDVYSFGVVLLEIVTGEPPMMPGHVHIVQRVKQKMAAGNIKSVADMRLGDAYEVTSMWKVVDIAMACTADTSVRRPTMATVVAQLKESLALEEARKDSGVRVSPVSDTASFMSTFGPVAR